MSDHLIVSHLGSIWKLQELPPVGIYSLVNKESGDYRTYRVERQSEEAVFAPGNTILSVLRGPKNSTDYMPVAFLELRDGSLLVHVWKKHRGSQWEALAAAFGKIWSTHSQGGKYEVLEAVGCKRCGELLTNPTSIRSGIGPICASRE